MLSRNKDIIRGVASLLDIDTENASTTELYRDIKHELKRISKELSDGADIDNSKLLFPEVAAEVVTTMKKRKKDLKSRMKKVVDLQQENQSLEDALQEAERKREELQNEVHRTREACRGLEEDNQKLRGHRNHFCEAYRDLNSRYEKVQDEHNSVSVLLAECLEKEPKGPPGSGCRHLTLEDRARNVITKLEENRTAAEAQIAEEKRHANRAGESAAKTQEDAKAEVAEAKKQIDAARKEAAEAKVQTAVAENRAAEAERKLAYTRGEAAEAKRKLEDTEKQLGKTRNRLLDCRGKLAKATPAKKQAAAAESELTDTKKQFDDTSDRELDFKIQKEEKRQQQIAAEELRAEFRKIWETIRSFPKPYHEKGTHESKEAPLYILEYVYNTIWSFNIPREQGSDLGPSKDEASLITFLQTHFPTHFPGSKAEVAAKLKKVLKSARTLQKTLNDNNLQIYIDPSATLEESQSQFPELSICGTS